LIVGSNNLDALVKNIICGTQLVSDYNYNQLAHFWTGNQFYNLIFDGNSLVNGVGASLPSLSFPAQLLSSLDYHFIGINDGLGGQTTWAMIYNYYGPAHPGLAQFIGAPMRSVLIAWELVNDMTQLGADLVTALNDWASYVALGRLSGYFVVALTLITRMTSAEGAGGYTPAQVIQVAAMNEQLLLNPGGIYGDAIVNVGADPRLQDPFGPNFNADHIHLSDAGYGFVAQDVKVALNNCGFLGN
jgi:lysophospholipase L1-like esterase